MRKKPLYRKVNTRAYGVHHWKGGDAKHDRNTKTGTNRSMKKGVQRGRDYTPLFKFLLSKVGQDWDAVYSEACARLDDTEPIFWMVHLGDDSEHIHDYVRIGDHSCYSQLIVDEDNKLQKYNPDYQGETIITDADWTWTFNGRVLPKNQNQHGLLTHRQSL